MQMRRAPLFPDSRMTSSDIADALGFSRVDLASNRTLKLSPRQAAEFLRAAKGLLGASLSVLGLGVALSFTPRIGLPRTISGALILVLGAIIATMAIRRIRAIRAEHVLVVEGPLVLSGPSDERGTKVSIGAVRLPDAKRAAALRILSAGARYRVYVLRGPDDEFLSLEPCDAGAHSALFPSDSDPSL
jgi:hypothetical protein